jgi:hypothetical protein
MTIQLIKPADLPPQATYTQVVVAAGTTVFVACQEPEDVHGKLGRLRRPRGASASGVCEPGPRAHRSRRTPDKVTKLTIYVVDLKSEYLPVIEQARLELFFP